MQYLNSNNVHKFILSLRIHQIDQAASVETFDKVDDFGNVVHVAVVESSLDVTQINNLIIPVATGDETSLLQSFLSSASDFENLPNWATWTAQEANDNIVGSIFTGKTLAQVETDIDNLPATIAGMKTGLKSAAAQIITIRTLLTFMAKAIVFLRDYTLRMRR